MRKLSKTALLSALLALVLSLSAFAMGPRVYDHAGFMSEDEVTQLEDAFASAKELSGVNFYAITRDVGSEYEDLSWSEFAAELIGDDPGLSEGRGALIMVSDMEDYILSAETTGEMTDWATYERRNELFEEMVGLDADGYYFEAFLVGMQYTLDSLASGEGAPPADTSTTVPSTDGATTAPPTAETDPAPQAASTDYLFDEADLLSIEQERALLATIERIRTEYNFDVTLVTTRDSGGSVAGYIVDHESLDLSRDGLIFGHDTSLREYYTESRGRARVAVTDAALEAIDSVLVPFLQDGDYYGAYSAYLAIIDEILQAEASGQLYGSGFEAMDHVKIIGIALLSGLLLAFIVTGVMKSAMNTAKIQRAAANYVKEGTLNISESRDSFSHNVTTRSKKAQSKSGGGGGSSRGGSGGGRY